MMHKTWKKPEPYLTPGMQVHGKWNKNVYHIQRKLGEGAIGSVYLCEAGGEQAALKISEKSSSITMEVNVLRSIDKAQDQHLGPYLLDVDDWIASNGERFSFYVMEYVQGGTLHHFIKRNGDKWIGVFMLQLLNDLEKLHQNGWVFGDLKAENLLITSSPPRMRWIDVGGTTRIGRAIKEYTEFYDRGYWEVGSRRAEASYDLFSFVMVFLSVYYPTHFVKKGKPKQYLFKKIDAVKALTPYNKCLKKAVIGKYDSSVQMKLELTEVIYQKDKRTQQTDYNVEIPEAIGFTIIAILYYLPTLSMF